MTGRPGPFVVDALGAARAYLNTVAGLAGPGAPLTNGVHLQEVRSPSSGTWARVELAPGRSIDEEGAWDMARVSVLVKARGSEAGAHAQVTWAANNVAEALIALNGTPTTVTIDARGTVPGQTVRILGAHSIDGPTQAGEIGGEVSMRVDATLRMQPV